jgi:hypothetical protein
VKIVQRVPVKIVIDSGLDPNLPLPLGISVEPTVTCNERRPARAGSQAANPWLIAVVVTLAAFMEVLDTTIVNVALPHIAGSLSVQQRRRDLGADLLSGGQRHRADRSPAGSATCSAASAIS